MKNTERELILRMAQARTGAKIAGALLEQMTGTQEDRDACWLSRRETFVAAGKRGKSFRARNHKTRTKNRRKGK